MDAPEIEKLKALALAYSYENGEHWFNEFELADGVTYEPGVNFIIAANPTTVLALIVDAERYRALRDLMQNAKGSASITVNQHLAYYEQCEPGEEVVLQWYPDTPIGFYTIEGSTLDQVADEAIEFIASKA